MKCAKDEARAIMRGWPATTFSNNVVRGILERAIAGARQEAYEDAIRVCAVSKHRRPMISIRERADEIARRAPREGK